MNRSKPILLVTVGVALLLVASVTAAQTDPEPVAPTEAPVADTVEPLVGDAPATLDPATADTPEAATEGEGEAADVVDPAEGAAPDQIEPGDTGAPTLDPATTLPPTTEPTTVPTDASEVIEPVVPEPEAVEDEDAVADYCIATAHPETLALPGPITLVVTPEDFAGDLTIEWEPSPHQDPARGYVSHYRVDYREGDGAWQELEEEVLRDVRKATLVGASIGQTYTFRVIAVAFVIKGESMESAAAESEPFTVRALPEELAPPTNLTLVRSLDDFAAGDDFIGTITIQWDLSADDGVRGVEGWTDVPVASDCLFAVKEY